MKKMKGVVSVETPVYPVYEDQRTRFRHQSLLQDYEDLHEETNSLRKKLLTAKQKKMILSAEVRFLRKRYKYLMKNPSPKPQLKQNIPKPQKHKIQAKITSKGQKYNRKESTLKPPTLKPPILKPPVASHLNLNERISNGVDIAFPKTKTAHMFDLNQNARSLGIKDPSFPSSAPAIDLNHTDRIRSGKEATKKSVTPFFDLNQISIEEEEELLGNAEAMRNEEPKRVTQRGVSEEQHNDIKLSACRNVGNGSSRTVKRKITWQDQVALRV